MPKSISKIGKPARIAFKQDANLLDPGSEKRDFLFGDMMGRLGEEMPRNTSSLEDIDFAEQLRSQLGEHPEDFYMDYTWVLDWIAKNFSLEEIFDRSEQESNRIEADRIMAVIRDKNGT